MKAFFSAKSILAVLYFLSGMLILTGIWAFVSMVTKHEIPTPLATWAVFKEVMHHPFQNDADTKGIGKKMLS